MPEISDNVFLSYEGREDPNSAKAGYHRPSSETPYNDSETPIKRRFTGGPMMAKYWTLAW